MVDVADKPLKPGSTAPKSGQYEEIGPRGGSTGHEVTVPKGKTMPPTQKSGERLAFVGSKASQDGGPV